MIGSPGLPETTPNAVWIRVWVRICDAVWKLGRTSCPPLKSHFVFPRPSYSSEQATTKISTTSDLYNYNLYNQSIDSQSLRTITKPKTDTQAAKIRPRNDPQLNLWVKQAYRVSESHATWNAASWRQSDWSSGAAILERAHSELSKRKRKFWVTFFNLRVQPHSFGAEAMGGRPKSMECCSIFPHSPWPALSVNMHPMWPALSCWPSRRAAGYSHPWLARKYFEQVIID